MTKRPAARQAGLPSGLIELDRFSHATLNQWEKLSRDLDEFQDSLFFGVLPEQRRLRPEIIGALRKAERKPWSLDNWCRIVTYRYSNAPLSCAGSLRSIGGRFNAGVDLDPGALSPWPALYLTENFETAFREKYQLGSKDRIDGLTAQELNLQPGSSLTAVLLQGELNNVFDLTSSRHLHAVAKIFGRIKMPSRAKELKVRLKSPAYMVQTAGQLFETIFHQNWRILPIQFGIPAPSQVFAEFVRCGLRGYFVSVQQGRRQVLGRLSGQVGFCVLHRIVGLASCHCAASPA